MNIDQLIVRELLKAKVKTLEDLACWKRKISRMYKIPCPSNVGLLRAYHELLADKSIKPNKGLELSLRTRPVRSLSGIVNVSVLTKYYPCPGNCLYCPNESGIPKSYLSGEPAVERAKKLRFDPYRQTRQRLEMLENEGHPTDKIELRVIGGTWSFYPKKYQENFIKKCFDACNDAESKKRSICRDLISAQKKNERAKHRIVRLSIETRPDFIDEKEIKKLRSYGVTKVELGVQSIYDDVLQLNRRGHLIEATVKATRLLKDAGFKISYQMMLNLPGSSPERDAEMFKKLFSSPDFQPDSLKVYPCALVKEAPLYQWYLDKKYQPCSAEELIETIVKIKKAIPPYVRIERVIRDISSKTIVEGPAKISNLRQVVEKKLQADGSRCQCIRCREIKSDYDPKEKVFLFRYDYPASSGQEIFLSFENEGREKIFSLLRLRIPSANYDKNQKPIFKVLENAGLIREMHTYGVLTPISSGKKISAQHKGLGDKLIKAAEKIAKKEFGLKKLAAISSVGAREYFKRSGFKLKEYYMIKSLKK
ncbi:MAG: tRNA uridine(34) 5-carboxymethylaminomethyl modification radical SAM/GNAT enzyme Elp3 [Candidatus Paceibacterota bacterium]|jgi:elongator complex protein 3